MIDEEALRSSTIHYLRSTIYDLHTGFAPCSALASMPAWDMKQLVMRMALCAVVWGMPVHAATPEWRVIRSGDGDTNLLTNGGMNEVSTGVPKGWQKFQDGFVLTESGGRRGSAGVMCEVTRRGQQTGIGQHILLDRKVAAPLVVRGWSKAEGVDGSPDGGYAIYVDIEYTDGTPLWGRVANFRCGTHDWQQSELVIMPEKPVKSLNLYCLLRDHRGKVWFDDVSVVEPRQDAGCAMFQGAPVTIDSSVRPVPPLPEAAQMLDYFAQRGAFVVRDVAAGSDFFRCGGMEAEALGLRVTSQSAVAAGHVTVSGRITSTVARDRAVTVVYALPLDATGWRWDDDIRRSREITGTGEFTNVVPAGCGATGTMSVYPVAAVWNGKTGVAIATDLTKPALCRLGYSAGLKRLFIAYDFGLSPETRNFPNSAEFRLVIYPFDPAEGFRSAMRKYMEIFPDSFVVRSKEQGLWMPFTDVSTVRGWEDFGFRYHEGDNNVPWDDAHGVLSFRYTEPMTWWMQMAKGTPRTPAAAKEIRDQLATGKDAQQRRMAEVSRLTAMTGDDGEPALRFEDTPWCDGAVWSLNPNPWLGQGSGDAKSPMNAATVYWNDQIKEQLYGPAAKGKLDGEYLDSLEGYVTANLNFRREHFATTTVPLVFATETRQAALFKGLAVCEFTRWISEDVHRAGHLMFANGVPYRFTFLCPWLDIMGTETNWLSAGKYQPPPFSQMDLWRTLSGGKPYLLLMNTDFDRFTPDLVEKYFNRCLFYGMWPGFFSHNAAHNPYWQNPKWYDRDRPMFRKFLPRIKQVAEAGWQPVTGATCDNPQIMLERYGPDSQGRAYLTTYNDTDQSQTGTVSLTTKPAGPNIVPWHVSLQAHEAGVIDLQAAERR